MVQVLETPLSPLQALTPQINQTVGNLVQGFKQRAQNKSDQKIINQFSENPNLSPMEVFSNFGKLSSQAQQSYSPLVQQILKTSGLQQVEQQKAQAKQAEETQEQQGLVQSLDWLEEHVPYTGTKVIPGLKSFTAGGLNREAVGKREEFDSTGFLVADKVFTHFNKGTISKDKLKVVQDDLAPNSNLSERANKARINSLRRMMGLPSDISKSEFDKKLDKELKIVNKEAGSKEKKSSSEKITVYDSSGKAVGKIDASQQKELPEGYTAK